MRVERECVGSGVEGREGKGREGEKEGGEKCRNMQDRSKYSALHGTYIPSRTKWKNVR